MSDEVERWRASTRAKAVAGSPERREAFVTTSEIPIADVYTADDVAGLDPDARPRPAGRVPVHPGRPGDDVPVPVLDHAPVRRASRPPPRPTSASGTCSARARPACRSPSTCRPRWATTATPPRRRGRSGRVGVPISSLADMEVLFAGIPLGEVSTSMTINATAPILLALYVAAAERQGVDRAAVSGTTQNDILKEYIARGTWIYPPRASMRLVTDVFEFACPRAPQVEHDQHLRLPHARGRGDGRPGARVHARRRDRLRRGGRRPRPGRGRLRAPPVVLLRRLVRAVRGGRQVPGGPPDVGPDHARPVRRIERPFDDVPVPHADGRVLADRPVDRQQRGPDDDPGARGRARRHPEPAHELARRGARAAHGGGRPPRPPDPADHRPRGRGDRDARPARRELVRRVADRRARGRRERLPRGDRRDGRHAGGDRGAGSSSARSRSRPTGCSGEVERGDRVVVGREPLPGRRRGRPAGDPAHRPGGGAAPDRGRPARARGAGRRRLGGRHARLGDEARGEANLLPAIIEAVERLRHGRRDLRSPAARRGASTAS